uniref:Uncharacterized protein n=1 Tax=Cyclophora tenuis TaxID=216820 RepID=A0A7S1GRM3_CYCTE
MLWENITAMYIRQEAYQVIGLPNIDFINVSVTLGSQSPMYEPPLSSLVTANTTNSTNTTNTSTTIVENTTTTTKTTAPSLPPQQQLPAMSDILTLTFDVEMGLMTNATQFNLRDYIRGAFDSLGDQQNYIADLRLTDTTELRDVILVVSPFKVPDPITPTPTKSPTVPPTMPLEMENSSSNNNDVVQVILVVAIVVVALVLAGFAVVWLRKRKKHANTSSSVGDFTAGGVSTEGNGTAKTDW